MDGPSHQLLREAEEYSAKKAKKRKRKRHSQLPEDSKQSSVNSLGLHEKNEEAPNVGEGHRKRSKGVNPGKVKGVNPKSDTKQIEAATSDLNDNKSLGKGEKSVNRQSSIGYEDSTQLGHFDNNLRLQSPDTTRKEKRKAPKRRKKGRKQPPEHPRKAKNVWPESQERASLGKSQQSKELALENNEASHESNENFTVSKVKSKKKRSRRTFTDEKGPEFEAQLTKNEKENKKTANLAPKPKIGQGPAKSPYFQKTSQRANLSCIPFPPLSASHFGLVQERLADSPFRLLVAVALLNKTRGSQAIPIYEVLMKIYPTPESLAKANVDEVADHIKCLGLQNTRAKRFVALAKSWVQDPPVCGRRHRILHYPNVGDGVAIKKSEILGDGDDRSGAWEIAHLPGVGAYALDSWRIFCRDKLRGLAAGWNGEGADSGFEPEWKRVVPKDKELRAFIRWSWLQLGIDFDVDTGEKQQAAKEDTSKLASGGVWVI